MFSLEKLCLDIIVQKFERLYCAFTVSKDDKLQRGFEFLQRRFSDQLATEYDLYRKKRPKINLRELGREEFYKKQRRERILEKQFFEFLINEHLTFLDDEWFRPFSDLISWIKRCSDLNSVDEFFCRLSNLTRIKLRDSCDKIIQSVAKHCPKVLEIRVTYSDVTDNGIKYLCERKNGNLPCPELKNVFIKYSDVTIRGAECLIRNLPSLEKIDHASVPILLYFSHEKNLLKSEEVHTYNLVELHFVDLEDFLRSEFCLSDYSDVLKACFTVCPKLKSVTCRIYGGDDLNLFNNRNFKELHLDCFNRHSNDHKIIINNFWKNNGRSLTSLKIADGILSVPVLGVHCPVLKKLSTKRVNFTADDNDLKPNFASLAECSFKDNEPSSDKALCMLLSSSSKLESISFESCMLSLDMKTQILLWCENPCSVKIKFKNITLEMEFLRDILLNCPSLKEMMMIDYHPESVGMREILKNLAKSLPNKPQVLFDGGNEEDEFSTDEDDYFSDD